jgi:hypothetical protein
VFARLNMMDGGGSATGADVSNRLLNQEVLMRRLRDKRQNEFAMTRFYQPQIPFPNRSWDIVLPASELIVTFILKQIK